ncbi:hypothetical protein QC761_603275 [Podospora bellae-mahoneyi]|uniref:Uncharacterized protein n=1 Tax=Podospora bellae-mahoneyi TaxID=2093777 RepID=A0ABR0FBE8_9PEZI|nr:hypothetical protein QC761_603275 [Podospora bellae-mahoneyi]
MAPIPPPPPPPRTSLYHASSSLLLRARSLLLLVSRQTPTDTIPASYGALYTSLTPGAIAGIVLGSVAGFCLVLYLVYTCINIGNMDSTTEGTASVVTRKSHHHRAHSRGERRRTRDIEITRTTREQSRGPVIVEERTGGGMESVILEERRRSYSRGGGGGVRRVVEVSDDDTGTVEDEVVVIEEHSPVRGGGRRRERSRIRSQERRSSGYREVDPERFAGGDARVVEVRRSSSHRR